MGTLTSLLALGVSLVSLVGALGKPLVSWGIEQRRSRLTYKRQMVQTWRDSLSGDFDRKIFRDTPVWSSMKPFMCADVVRSVESSGMVIGGVIRAGEGDKLKRLVLDEIARVERRWRLL